MPKKTVVVALSGGVDSSAAAMVLKDEGYNVIGLFMNNWEEEEDGGVCTSADDWRDALSVAGKLDIPAYSVNFSKEYMEGVFKYFLEEYKKGRTPNPDVLCNREIKFKRFKEFAATFNPDYIATGHYCNIGEKDSQPILLRAADKAKDQTYFLNQVSTRGLENVLFPIGRLKKPEVRELAEKAGLVTARKKDSTGICFIGERNFKKFLMTYLPAMPGKIIDTTGREIGVHDGLMYYTLGQRRGLGIGGIKESEASRWYVIKKNLENNTLVVSCGEGEELFSQSLAGSGFNIIGSVNNIPFGTPFACTAKTRYRQPDAEAEAVINKNGTFTLNFAERQRAVTPGQYAVVYSGERALGGGVIDSTY